MANISVPIIEEMESNSETETSEQPNVLSTNQELGVGDISRPIIEELESSSEIEQPNVLPSNHEIGGGDAIRIDRQPSKDESAPKNPKQKMSEGDATTVVAKQSRSSTLSTAELEQRMNLRLQMLAEFENSQKAMENTDEDEKDIKSAQTWEEFWQQYGK